MDEALRQEEIRHEVLDILDSVAADVSSGDAPRGICVTVVTSNGNIKNAYAGGPLAHLLGALRISARSLEDHAMGIRYADEPGDDLPVAPDAT